MRYIDMLEFDQEEFKAVTEPTCLLQDVTGQKSAKQLFLVHQHLSGAQPTSPWPPSAKGLHITFGCNQ